MKLDKVFPDVPEDFHNRVIQTLDSQDDYAMERMKAIRITKKLIIIAVATILICSLSLGAYALIMWNPKFAELFNADDAQQQNLMNDKTTVVIDQEVEDSEVKFEAVQMIADKSTAYILLRITGPEDVLKVAVNIGGFEISIGGVSDFGHMGLGMVYEETPADDNERYFQIYIIDEKLGDLAGEMITIKMKDLRTEFDIIQTGEWELSWPMNFVDHTKALISNETQYIDGKQVTIESIELSPISISLKLGGEEIYELAKTMEMTNDFPFIIRISLMMEDGTIFDSVDGGGSEGWRENEGVYSIFRSFSNVLDVEKVTALSLTYTDGVTSEVLEFPVVIE